MRPHEEFTKDSIVDFLSASGHEVRVEPGAEPPDYTLVVDGLEMAFEVTTLTDEVNPGKERITIETALDRLVRDIEQLAIEEGILKGTYFVKFLPVDVIPNFRKNRKIITESMLDYVRLNQADKYAPPMTVFEGDRMRITIEKFTDYGSTIEVFPIDTAWRDGIRDVSHKLLDFVLAHKLKKLEKEKRPKVLGILNAYHFGSVQKYLDVVSHCRDGSSFHGIFLVQGDRSVTPLRWEC